jgi:hypothetical protein
MSTFVRAVAGAAVIGVLVILLWLAVVLCVASSGEKYDREWLPNDIRGADLVAIGTLTGVWTYPWKDGWHRRGTIKIERVLFQSRPYGTAVTLTWGRLYGRSFSCPDWAKFEHQQGVWILREYTTYWDDRMNAWCGNGMERVKTVRRLKAAWTRGFAGGYLPVNEEAEITSIIRRLRPNR